VRGLQGELGVHAASGRAVSARGLVGARRREWRGATRHGARAGWRDVTRANSSAPV
jgi:hypothetical protein